MLLSKSAVFLLLCLVASGQASDKWKSYSIHLNQNLEGKTLIDPREDSPVLVFGYCHHGRCTFFREREHSGENFDSASHLRSCNFNFDKGEVLELYPFGSDKIVFMYEATDSNKRFGILNLSSCKSYIATINDGVKMMFARVMVTDEYNFEITVSNYHEGDRCRNKTCRMTFNDEGRNITDLLDWIPEDNYRFVSLSDTTGSYIVVDANVVARTLGVYKVNETGHIHVFQNFTSNLIPPVSTTYNFVTTCGTSQEFIKCQQFDRSGKPNNDSTLLYKHVKQAKLHNLPGGGFVLLTSTCPKSIANCDEPISHFFVTRVDVTGKITGSFKVTEFSADLYFQLNNVHFFMKDNNTNELCFSHVSKRYLRSGDEQIVEIYCYNTNIVGFVNDK